MPSDGRAGVHRENCGLVDSMALYSGLILLMSVFSSCDKVIKLLNMLEIMFRLYASTAGTHSGRFLLLSY